MPKSPTIILDSSVIVSALLSSTGASAEIINLAENKKIMILLPRYIEEEVEDVLERKFPFAISNFRELSEEGIFHSKKNPGKSQVSKARKIIKDPDDAPILASAMKAKVDYLVTLDQKDFIADPEVAAKSKLKITTPGVLVKLLRS